MSDSPELAPTSTPQRARASVFLWRGEVRARGHSRPGGAAVRTHRANGMVNPGEPGPTPDSPEKPATPAEGGAKPEENNGWFDNLWRKTQKDAEDTIKFIEEEHKKNCLLYTSPSPRDA